MRTVEEKYNFLLKHLQVTDIDLWENDALIVLSVPSIYFQFPVGVSYEQVSNIDYAIEEAMGKHFIISGSTDSV